SLSPLLEGYAASEAGETGVATFHRIAAYSWFGQKRLSQSQFFHLVTNALAAKEDFLVAHAGYILVTTEREKFRLMAKELALLCLLGTAGEESLKDLHPVTRHLFRTGLLRIAAQNRQATTYIKLDAAIISELESKQGEEFLKDLLFGHYAGTCATQDSPLPIKELIRRAIKAVELFQKR